MARILLCTHPITGHLNPALVIARKLVARGHDVRVYTGHKFKAKVEAAGAHYVPMTAAYDYDDADYNGAFPARRQLEGLNQIKFDFKHVFIEQLVGETEDLRAILREWPADVVLSDPAFTGAWVLYMKGEIKNWVVFNITVLGLPSKDVPPFGLGVMPDYSLLGKLKSRVLTFIATKVVFRDVNQFLAEQCRKVGLPEETFAPMFSPMLYLQPTVPALEYPRSDLPASVHFVGPLLPELKQGFQLPAWWGDIVQAQKPVVMVTQGTIATNADELILSTLQALAQEDVLVVATLDPATVTTPLPANARLHAFIPFDQLVPLVDVMVTNGGYGGVTFALANGVPVVCAGITEDKPEVGNRVTWAGVGINLKTNRPTVDAIRQAVQQVLREKSYGEKAKQIQAEFAKQDAAEQSALLVEQLIATQQPVVRNVATPLWTMP